MEGEGRGRSLTPEAGPSQGFRPFLHPLECQPLPQEKCHPGTQEKNPHFKERVRKKTYKTRLKKEEEKRKTNFLRSYLGGGGHSVPSSYTPSAAPSP